MQYKIWDIVRVRKDLEIWEYWANSFVPSMLQYRWKEWKIIGINDWNYRIKWMNHWNFTDEMVDSPYKEWEYIREIICTDEKWEEIQKILKLNK
jgi:hypothetical protein